MHSYSNLVFFFFFAITPEIIAILWHFIDSIVALFGCFIPLIYSSHTILRVHPAISVLSVSLKCYVQTELFPMAWLQFLGISFVAFVQDLCSFSNSYFGIVCCGISGRHSLETISHFERMHFYHKWETRNWRKWLITFYIQPLLPFCASLQKE